VVEDEIDKEPRNKRIKITPDDNDRELEVSLRFIPM